MKEENMDKKKVYFVSYDEENVYAGQSAEEFLEFLEPYLEELNDELIITTTYMTQEEIDNLPEG